MSIASHTSTFASRLWLVIVMLCFSVLTWGQAPVASFSSATQSGCAPLSVNFNNTSTNAASYQWDFGNGNFSTLVNPQNVYIQPGVYTVQLIVTAANGNRDTLTRQNYISATPGPQLAVSVNTYNGCDNYTQFQFNCVSPDATNYHWDFGDGSTSSLMNPPKTYANTGNYNVSLLATNINGCQTVVNIPQPVQVIATPQASYSVDITSTCDLQQNFHFTSGSVTSDTYAWDFGDGLTSSAIHPNHVFANSGVFSVELKMTNAFGCADSITIPNVVTVFPDNTPIISGNLSGCLPFATTLSSQVVGATSYSWHSSDGQSATTPTFSVTYFPAGNYNITLQVVMPNGCTYSLPQPTVVQVNPKPTAAFTATNTVGCAPLNVNLTNTSIGATNYYWTFGDGGYSFLPNPIYYYQQPGVYTITLKAYNQFGCWRTVSVNNITVTAPQIYASMSNTTGCPPLDVAFTNTTINAISYLWDFGDGTTSTDSIPEHTYTTLGQYQVSLIAYGSGGCSDTLVFAGGVNVTAQLANYPTPSPIAGCAPFQTSFGINDPSITSFLWDFGDGSTSTAASPSHTYTTPGNYTVSLQVSDGSICGLVYPVYQQITVEGITPKFDVWVDPCPPHLVHFTDTISDAVSWLWDFGDGTTSTLQNPTHIYASSNNYHVGLTITTASGCERTYVGFNAVTFTNYQASFTSSYNPTAPYPVAVSFTPQTPGATSWLWNFGDGTTSTLENPVHTYATAGNYTVTLTVMANGCSHTCTGNPFAIPSQSGGNNGSGGSEPPTTVIPSQPFISCAPASISFFRQSPLHQIIQWSFGDGTFSTQTNPVKVYTSPGIYNVSYTATSPSGPVTVTYPQSIHIGGFLPDIAVTTHSDCNTFYIATGLNNAALFDQVHWKFGNSAIYNGLNVNYQLPFTNGSVVIRAMVTDTLGCSAVSVQSILMNKPMPFVAYPTTVCRDSIQFEQLGSTSGLSFLWNFGDGTTSTLAEPIHQYDSTGAYHIQLQITTDSGCVYNYTLAQDIVFATPKLDMIVNGAWEGCAPHHMELIFPAPLAYVNYYYNSTFLTNSDTLQLSYPDTGTYNGLSVIATTTWISGCRDTLQFPAIHVYDAFADFSFVQNSNCLPADVQFQDESLEAVSWEWDFGNGITSTQQNPLIHFTTAPADSFRLIIHTAFGCSDTIVKPGILIHQLQHSISYQGACNPLTVAFAATSNLPSQYEWHLENGVVMTDSAFTYVYTNDGFQTPYVVATTSGGCVDTSWVTPFRVTSIQADFVSPSPAACAPSVVEFSDLSNGAVSWNWDFGDNSGSALQNPTKLYDTPGIYSIRLIVTSIDGCTDTLIRSNYITVLGPATSFSVSTPQGCVGVPLQFQDLSQNAVKWEWNFGEGSTSTEQSPSFEYAQPGSYIITLFANDTIGCSAFYSIPVAFVINDRPHAAFTLAADSGCTPFTPIITNTTPDAINYSWNFGDGSAFLTDSVPVYAYPTAGDYFIELVAGNAFGCYDTARIEPVHSLLVPKAALTINEGTGCLPLMVSFENASIALETPSYLVSFADTVTIQNPDTTYAFSVPGYYDVALTVTNFNGCSDTILYPAAIEVFDSIPPPASPIIRVSVESPDSVILEWYENLDSQFMHYNILRRTAGVANYVSIATIANRQITSFYDTQLNTQDSVYCYKVEAVDICNRRMPLDSLIEHCTINIQAITLQNNTIDINWTPYVGRVPSSYLILRTEVASQLIENIATVGPNQTHYIDSSVVCPVQYRYDILAVELDGLLHIESASDYDLPAPVRNPFLRQFVNIGRSTVINDEKILTEWAIPDTLTQHITGFGIYRAEVGGTYMLQAELPANQTYYMDDQVDVHKVKYEYQVFARNSCKVESAGGMKGDNIVLQIEPYNDVFNMLNWTPYESWGEDGVGFYVIEKQDENGQWHIIKTVLGDEHSYLDENF